MTSRKNCLNLSDVAHVLKARLIGADCSFTQISINSRTVHEGELFIAIKGERFDGHDYLSQAVENGACAVVVEQEQTLAIPQLLVTNSRQALGMIASLWRDKFSLPMVAITGSCGKTTVKEMTAAIFRQAHQSVLATQGNLNNDIGVPLTLMQLNNTHKMAVLEMGANHPGEIAQLVNYVKPKAALITNVSFAHIEGFASIEGVAQAKSEIYQGLGLQKQVNRFVAIINADDDFADYWRAAIAENSSHNGIDILTFGLNNKADISAEYSLNETGSEIVLNTPEGSIPITLPHYGKHNVANALAASALAISMGCSLMHIKTGLETSGQVSGRLEQKQGIADSILFDDSYNANPGSVVAGIEALQSIAGDRVLVLGDMAELGEQSEQLHYQLGVDAARLGIKQLFTVGSKSHACSKAFRTVKEQPDSAWHFVDKEQLIRQLKAYLLAQQENHKTRKVILVKGSRTMAMETVVKALLKDSADADIQMIKEGVH